MKILRSVTKPILHSFYTLAFSIHKNGMNYNRGEDWALGQLRNLGYVPNCSPFHDITVYSNEKYDLTLCVPVFNSEKFLEQCISALLTQQTKYKYQIVFVDDGSTDSSLEILKNCKNDNVVVYSQKNQGISAARNKCIELSEGTYIGFVDNDDIVSVNYVEKLLDVAFRHKSDVVKCGHTEFADDGSETVDCLDNSSYQNGIGADLVKYNGLVWGGIYKRNLWHNTSFPVGYWYEDMVTRLLLYSKAVNFDYLGEVLYRKRNHISNASKVLWKKVNVKTVDQIFLPKCILNLQIQNSYDFTTPLLKAYIYEIGSFAVSRVRKEYLPFIFPTTIDIVNELLSRIKCLDYSLLDKDEMDFLRAVKNADYQGYYLWMQKKRFE